MNTVERKVKFQQEFQELMDKYETELTAVPVFSPDGRVMSQVMFIDLKEKAAAEAAEKAINDLNMSIGKNEGLKVEQNSAPEQAN